MQVSLKQIRQVLGFGVQEFGDLIGLTRQTINNLETQKNKMSSIQYIAICAVIDNCLKDKPELLPILSTILCSNEDENHGNIFETIENGSLLKKWFLCFPDESKILRFGVDDTGIIDQILIILQKIIEYFWIRQLCMKMVFQKQYNHCQDC